MAKRTEKTPEERGLTRALAYELSEDQPLNPSAEPTIGAVIEQRLSRRGFVARGVAAAAASTLSTLLSKPALAATGAAAGAATGGGGAQPAAATHGVGFTEIRHGVDDTHHVAAGYQCDVLIRWGDPIFDNAPEFDPQRQTAAAQRQQFGYNNDYVGFVPLPPESGQAERGLLCVNHEYTNEELMFPGLGRQERLRFRGMTRALVDIEMAAHGGTVVEIARAPAGKWRVVRSSPFNRRITATTPMRLSGPAAGDARVRTTEDSAGTRVIGTVNNCAGGITPWGTYLMAEENFHGYFWGAGVTSDREAANHRRYGVPGRWYAWGKYYPRFDVSKEPNEPNRFGWIVEVDPLDPESMPVKRTALGRFKHEGAESIVNRDGRLVVYMGDDQRFDYIYKFVSHGVVDEKNRSANSDLLDSGKLFVAKFETGGLLRWLPLEWGNPPLDPTNGFESQADVLIEARRAADLLKATPMDRPEDVQPDPRTGRVYVLLTNNTMRTEDQVDEANPRARNAFGQIIEITPPRGDHAAPRCQWEILVRCGDPKEADVGAQWNPAVTDSGWFADPDNAAIDDAGNLWVATDQGAGWHRSGTADGLWMLETSGPGRGRGHMFFRVPVGAECCGPCFTPDGETLFVAVQHPGADGVEKYAAFKRGSTFEDPATRWPDFDPAHPPRPSVMNIRKTGGGKIGT